MQRIDALICPRWTIRVEPHVVVETDPRGFYGLVVDRDVDHVGLEGDRGMLERLLGHLPAAPAAV